MLSYLFLNKACVNIGSSSSNLCGVPTVENVESLKSLVRITPVWSSGILVFVGMLQAFPTLEAEKMNRNITSWFEIPAASFTLFMLLSITIWIPFYDRVFVPFLAKFTHEPRGLNPKTRMGVGIILSIIAMVVSTIVETIRRDLANSNTPVDMSAMWLVPQFVLLGLTEAFNGIGQLEFYYSELPNSMASLVMFTVSMAVASLVACLLTNIVDSVTGQGGDVLSFLNLLNYLYYLICCVHLSFSSSERRLSDAVHIEG
ncbi:putative proton-dependent oligopeptide transporter family, MFS transporter superfamily [Helianthus annuus]|nr:putative proton-dependent oligopeptide transporter family, MFS transporter superfamily [Helianthus annuus]